MTRPRSSTIQNVVLYLESIGLDVIGPYVDLNDGEIMGGNMTFDARSVVTYMRLHKVGALHIVEREEFMKRGRPKGSKNRRAKS